VCVCVCACVCVSVCVMCYVCSEAVLETPQKLLDEDDDEGRYLRKIADIATKRSEDHAQRVAHQKALRDGVAVKPEVEPVHRQPPPRADTKELGICLYSSDEECYDKRDAYTTSGERGLSVNRAKSRVF